MTSFYAEPFARHWRRRLQGGVGAGTGSGGARLVAVKVREEQPSGEASGLSIVTGGGAGMVLPNDGAKKL